MASNLTNKKIKVLVVDPSGPVRQMMSETIRQVLGFEQVEGKASVADALQHLEGDSADWILLPLMPDQPVNALHLLKLCSEHAALRQVRLSLLVSDEELYILPKAFELGLLSFHHKPFTKDTLTSEMKLLLSTLEAKNFNEPQTAAHYLRQHLRQAKSYEAQAELEKGLLDVYPGDPQILLHLAEPQFHLGQQDLARKTLSQVKVLDQKLTDKVAEVSRSLFGDADAASAADGSGGPTINVLGAKTAVIIDSDESSARALVDILKQLGCPKTDTFANGQDAWNYLEKNPEPDLIITEWRVPKLSGPMLIQRIRHHGFLNVPIVVLSSLLKPEDMPLVREISVAEIIQKPLNKDLFIPALIWTMQQERLPTEQLTLERKIRLLLKNNRRADAEALRVQLLGDKQTPMSRKRLIEAEFAYAAAQYTLARDAAVEALKLAGDGINVLNILGKAFMRLSSFEAALKCFKKAQAMSPLNIERLCLIAETQTELGNHEEAKANLDSVNSLDPDAKAASEAKVKVAITRGDSAAAKKIMGSFESIDNIVSYMNNKAVALAKCGEGNEAIDLYAKTLESVPDEKTEPKSVVLYNLALAKIKAGDFDGAITHLAQVVDIKGCRVEKKAQSLLDRLKAAQTTGKEFKMRVSEGQDPAKAASPAGSAQAGDKDDPKLATEDDFRRMLAAVDTKRGDICCYLIFNAPGDPDVRTTALLAKPPRFQTRVAIERAEVLLSNDRKAG